MADVNDYDWPVSSVDGAVAIVVQFDGPSNDKPFWRGCATRSFPVGSCCHRTAQLAYGTVGPTVATQLYTADQLRGELDGLEIKVLREYDALVREGTGHYGMSALVDLVATCELGL